MIKDNNGRFQIGIIGYGSIGQQLYGMLVDNGFSEEDIFIFADDVKANNRRFAFRDYIKDDYKYLNFFPALGYLSTKLKKEIIVDLKSRSLKLFSFTHPAAFVSPSAKIGGGVLVYPMCNIDQNVEIQDGCIIHNSSIVSHDTIIRECVYVSPGVCLTGNILINSGCFIGAGSTIANGVKVGVNCIIGIGTCLTKSIEPESFVIGNPFVHKNNINLL